MRRGSGKSQHTSPAALQFAAMKLNTMNHRMNTRVASTRPARTPKFITRAVAAPELSPKEAGVEGAANQLDALKKMSKIVADSGVRLATQRDQKWGTVTPFIMV